MSQAINTNREEWLKVLGKGMVTLPKRWRDEMGIGSGDMVRAKKEGNKVVIEATKSQKVPYRVYTAREINEFLKDDELPKVFAQKVRQHLSLIPQK
ncbi:hypothetical protein A3A93_04930 [Candidatus Roizmanbacteria bacterium RIFCSPLOWO2_01_FULL_38_12]|uniref:SpoVT-AbrB domain-containing protein n=1 Tax=Candidatus Roizmanbacteria bacterium RIFCSPLOWO2_01_FULL_38_12 TaxID=1802061 RepID=A0A1F7J0N8_9BACT|nr:MAG: hypothetical protein A2861_03375 [Candidatus Roizmanbacteria bacterium RIFCSPHIGHO2_01_FULL_38_15]OGK36197.1 MAG: hypothetical protein A3F59_04485 [Candidatus Roizmanbacteria bacterium RIFCSPHIGHO2_12_FULL_38_13]OGK49180.1 MAG: hypothetical protein A3A93_04930 [Candidatus Roizmanbacteria bacterium RIFCSPLOWO2_01_FULL_38_12]